MSKQEIRKRNLVVLIAEYGKQRALADKLDISPSQISQIVNGIRKLGEKQARSIEEKTGKPEGWLDRSEDERAQRDIAKEDAISYPSVGESVDIRGFVPLISWVQAGDWHDAVDNFSPGDGDDILPCPVPHSKNTYAVQVSGDSMIDEYPEGYIIFVDPNIQPKHKDDVIVRLLPDNEVTFKRYTEDGGKRYLKAMNKDWPNPIIPINGDAEFCGVVIFAGKYPQRNL